MKTAMPITIKQTAPPVTVFMSRCNFSPPPNEENIAVCSANIYISAPASASIFAAERMGLSRLENFTAFTAAVIRQ